MIVIGSKSKDKSKNERFKVQWNPDTPSLSYRTHFFPFYVYCCLIDGGVYQLHARIMWPARSLTMQASLSKRKCFARPLIRVAIARAYNLRANRTDCGAIDPKNTNKKKKSIWVLVSCQCLVCARAPIWVSIQIFDIKPANMLVEWETLNGTLRMKILRLVYWV